MSKKILLIRCEGAIIAEQASQPENISFLPGVISNLSKICAELDYELVMIADQETTFSAVHSFITKIFLSENIVFTGVVNPVPTPGNNMLNKYLFGVYDLANSYCISNNTSDTKWANDFGCRLILTGDAKADTALSVANWNEIYRLLKQAPRIATINRKTNETDISVQINLDGSGNSDITTGVGFLDHMLQQISRHGNIDMNIVVKGDLETDEHHTIEDTAIALGEAVLIALGNKKGIERYGFLLPMDDCLAQVAIDFGGRPWLVWDAVFKREKIGDAPTEMFYHFFKSFSDQARCNLNIKATGENEHHKIESIFKAFAKAIKMAVTKTGNNNIPSTKGIL
jgi:imidazoleglycerol-phosphate dehydratase / histidinol-phosphatase